MCRLFYCYYFIINKNVLISFYRCKLYMQPNNTKQEFFTLDSRLTIQRGNIYQKKLKHETEASFNRFIVFMMLLILLVIVIIYDILEERKYLWIVQALLILTWLWPHIKRVYQTLFIKTWKSIIPIKDIKDVSTKPLDNGLETEVTLHLSSGRKKFYTFRNAEGQLELFVEAISAQISIPAQPAV